MAKDKKWRRFLKKKNIDESTLKDRLSRLNPRAKKYAKDPKETEKLLQQAREKADDNQSPLKNVWQELQLMLEMLRAWWKKDYQHAPYKSIVAIIAGLIYFVSPIDLIPDFLPGGLIDDAAVISFVFKQVHKDLDDFKEWKLQRDNTIDADE